MVPIAFKYLMAKYIDTGFEPIPEPVHFSSVPVHDPSTPKTRDLKKK